MNAAQQRPSPRPPRALAIAQRRIVVGAGARAALMDELAALDVERVLFVCTPGRTATVAALGATLGRRFVGTFDRAAMHTPIERVLEARRLARDRDADAVIAFGGGTALGIAKAVALERDVRVIAIPTTFSGSETTHHVGITEAGVKRTRIDERVLPALVLCDPELVRGVPAIVLGPSGMNALAHSVEAVYGEHTDAYAGALAEEAVRLLARSLPRVFETAPSLDGALDATADAMLGSALSGMAMSVSGVCLHHKLCHTLGGTFGLPHAETHATLLAYVLAFNAPSIAQGLARLARALDTADPVGAIWSLRGRLGCPASLAEIGFRHADIDRAVEIALRVPYYNPRPFDADDLRAILRAATDGAPPLTTHREEPRNAQ